MTGHEERVRGELAAAAAQIDTDRTLDDLRAKITSRTRDDMNHMCPVRDCTRDLPDFLLMCRPHWQLVPAALQRAVYAAYGRGRGVGTQALYEAQTEAIRAVDGRLGRIPRPPTNQE